jgi:IS30 family transposase
MSIYTHLRHRGKKYQHRGSKNAGRGCIPHRIDIQERPAIVEEKIRLGDWEIDLIIGAQQQGAILSMVDRASKYTLLAPLPNKTAAGVTTAILDAFHRPLPDAPQHLVHTITSDNGKEFAAHRQIAAALDCAFFFATPYHSWERGLNEHVNGLVRQYLPKKMTFSHLTSAHTLFIEDRLNHRPRKVLQYRTPYEVWSSNSPAQLIALRS